MTEQPTRGVLLVGHGTRDEEGTAQFFALGRLLAERMQPLEVESALLEFQRPTIREGWESLVARGVCHIHVAPLLLFAAGHAKQDIPEIIKSCREVTPHVTADQSRPISRHPAIIDLVLEHLNREIQQLGPASTRTAIVMVGRGSRDPCAQADMRVLSEVVSRRVKAAVTKTAFYAMAQPSLPEVLDQVATRDDVDAVVVSPHLLFEGRLYRSILKQTEDASRRHRAVRFAPARYLGPDLRVAEAIATRIEQSSIDARRR